ncbi:response regulator transcription factor [Arthrobacter rhombi]|uniref:response regulator transcription factor n=1 Tax=Arthrobacter rhombi TaxID=71253 RepID=UPI003FD4EBBE
MIRIAIADDEHMLRTALVALLDLEEGLAVVGQFDNGQRLLAATDLPETDVYVLDLEMPVLGGLETTKALLERDPDALVVIITKHAKPGVLRSALAAGVRGFVPKNTSAEELTRIINRIHAGERYVDADLAIDAIGFDCPLTERELDALRLTEAGLAVPEIAATLHLATGTVRNYLSDAITKLGVTNRHAAAKTAQSSGWI